MSFEIINGDALETLRKFPADSCNMCVTSPPYYGLRNYENDGQIGLEETPEQYINKLVLVFREVHRVLKDDGTLWINIGDSYATRSGPQPPANTRNSCGHTAKTIPEGYKYKDLIGIPWLLAFALRSDGWYLRQDIIWQKPNCMPESVKDRCTKSHEYIFLLAKSPKYFYNAEAISEPIAPSSAKRYLQNIEKQKGSEKQPGRNGRPMKAALPTFGANKYKNHNDGDNRKSGNTYTPTPRKNKRSVWTISTAGYKGAHFAVFPENLVLPCVLAGSKPGDTVLDPFSGSGTTGVVSTQQGRNYIGIEINSNYCAMSERRIKEANNERNK